jgi:hypothetical protein
LLQPIDLSIGKPLKDQIRKQFHEWFQTNHNNLNPSGTVKNPSHSNIMEWIEKSMLNFNKNIIAESFKLGGYTVDILNKEEIKTFNSKLLKKEKILQMLEKCFDRPIYEGIDDMYELGVDSPNSIEQFELVERNIEEENLEGDIDYEEEDGYMSYDENNSEDHPTDSENEDEENLRNTSMKFISNKGQISIFSYFNK